MRFSKLVMILSLLGGLALLGGMVWHVGLSGLLESFRAMGFWWRRICCCARFLPCCTPLVGPPVFRDRVYPSDSGTVLVMRAGSAINQVTPSADIGGEIVRVLLLKPFLPQEQALAAVAIDKTSATMAHMLYLAFGMLTGHPIFTASRGVAGEYCAHHQFNYSRCGLFDCLTTLWPVVQKR